MAYATAEDFQAYSGQTLGSGDQRLLERASEVVDEYTLGRIDTSKDYQAEAAKKAVCAQIEYWLEVGDDVDISGTYQSFKIGSMSVDYGSGSSRTAPQTIAPRAHRALMLAGLLYRGVNSI